MRPVLALLLVFAAGVHAQAITWNQRHDTLSVETRRGADMAGIDGDGNVFVAGTIPGRTCASIARVDAADGRKAWQRDNCFFEALPFGLVVDASGDPIMAAARSIPGQEESRITKYANVDGMRRWEQSIPGKLVRLALDPAGNVIVAGAAGLTKYTNSGAIVWQVAYPPPVASEIEGFALDGGGNPSVALISVGAPRRLMRFRGDNGNLLWNVPYVDVMTALAADGFGDTVTAHLNFVVPDPPAIPHIDAYITKYDGATGAVVWATSYATSKNDSIAKLLTDSQGSIYAAGSTGAGDATDTLGSRQALLKWTRGGALAWKAFQTYGENTSIAIDADGAVVTGGYAYGFGLDFEASVTKVRGTDGAPILRKSFATPGGYEFSIAALAYGSALYGVGSSTIGGLGGLRVVKYANGTTADVASNVHGLWWHAPPGSESGWGVNLSQQGDVLFATWFTYDLDGQGMWLVMSAGRRFVNDLYVGTLYRATGAPFNAFDGVSNFTLESVGTASLRFTDGSNGTLTYTLAGTTGGAKTKAITRQFFASPAPTCELGGPAGAAPNYTDLWWRSPAGTEAGWGVNLAHQGDVLFGTWFTYDANGKGMWLVMSNGARIGPARYSGPLYRTTGPAIEANPWNPSQVVRTQVGTASFTFSDANNGVFDYSVNGIAQSKPITRQVFGSPVTVCR